jgi:oligoribonuclease
MRSHGSHLSAEEPELNRELAGERDQKDEREWVHGVRASRTLASDKITGNMGQGDRLIWIDLEMTGLAPERDRIIEIATVVTDADLAVIAEGPVIAVRQAEATLAGMDEWNTRTHVASGLVARVRASTTDDAAAERATLAFLAGHVAANRSPMCGNSVCQDRRFLARWMPELERYFHYRNLDVSTVKELARRWAPEVAAGVEKESRHTALADVHESIAELRHYRQALFATPWNAPRD